jgi:hypothetical protein
VKPRGLKFRTLSARGIQFLDTIRLDYSIPSKIENIPFISSFIIYTSTPYSHAHLPARTSSKPDKSPMLPIKNRIGTVGNRPNKHHHISIDKHNATASWISSSERIKLTRREEKEKQAKKGTIKERK